MKVIINADEFGVARSINLAIYEAFNKGVLTSATIVCGGEDFDFAVNLAKKNERIKCGIHLYLTDFTPCAPISKILSLINNEGILLNGVTSFLKRYFFKRINFNEVYFELEAQFKKAVDSLPEVTHIDGHNNLHVLPEILDIILELMNKYNMNKLRLPKENIFHIDIRQPTQYIIKNGIYYYSIKAKRRIPDNIRYPKRFYGIAYEGKVNEKILIKYFKNSFKCKSLEIMVHPASFDQAKEKDKLNLIFGHGQSFIGNIVDNYDWETEFKALISPKVLEFIEKNDIRLISFDDL